VANATSHTAVCLTVCIASIDPDATEQFGEHCVAQDRKSRVFDGTFEWKREVVLLNKNSRACHLNRFHDEAFAGERIACQAFDLDNFCLDVWNRSLGHIVATVDGERTGHVRG
jgi:hypothetical protein